MGRAGAARSHSAQTSRRTGRARTIGFVRERCCRVDRASRESDRSVSIGQGRLVIGRRGVCLGDGNVDVGQGAWETRPDQGYGPAISDDDGRARHCLVGPLVVVGMPGLVAGVMDFGPLGSARTRASASPARAAGLTGRQTGEAEQARPGPGRDRSFPRAERRPIAPTPLRREQ